MASEQGQGEQTSSMAGAGAGDGMEQKLEKLMSAFHDHQEGNKAVRHEKELEELFSFLREHEAAFSQLPGNKKDDLDALLRNIEGVLELCKKPSSTTPEEEKKKKKKKKMGDCIPFKSSSRPPDHKDADADADAEPTPSVVAPLLKQARDILRDSSSSAPAGAGAGPNKKEVLYEWTTSYVDEERLYGWDDEAKEVADALAGPEEDDDDKEKLFRAAGIFGIHGSGKTALAQKVFVHDRIKDTFPLRLWVCVGPTPPDDDKQQQYEVKFSLLYRMLDNLGLDTYKVEGVVNASEAVKKHGGDGDSDAAKESKIGVLLFILHVALAKTSYLIVLDDIRAYDPWYTNLALPPPPHGEWSDRLGYGLPKLKKSAVLVTCRKEEHARAMVRTGRVFHPPLLAVADAWKLFEREYLEAKKKQVGYNVKDDMLYNDLKVVQEEMVGKCLGLPVAILEAAKGFAQYCTYVDDDDAKTTQPTTAKGADAGDPADHAAA
uniref:NB-ARC domain-containing protein n=1 Tax=Oryza barthii TaxID=65489 RepID=A0A0D3GLB5_9ORYZ